MHVRQAVVPALESVGQPQMIDSQQVQDRSIQVVDMHAVANDVVAEVVRLAESYARRHTAPKIAAGAAPTCRSAG